jgi:phenylalanine-4-hydroxylase
MYYCNYNNKIESLFHSCLNDSILSIIKNVNKDKKNVNFINYNNFYETTIWGTISECRLSLINSIKKKSYLDGL